MSVMDEFLMSMHVVSVRIYVVKQWISAVRMHNETRNTQNIMDNRCIITVSDQMAELLSEFQDNDFFKSNAYANT